ncbi:hypothetical protein PAEVO_03510 [Paenibacillus sp. GM2FR]|uniref:hypothetical protein n=1 Tax=Paenibacillus sp. GM2FR TaxID=2059268 RepID=UPI000C270C3C|nr:hypothetical protein [Paenibacillus sp. GM2FR]PJN53631.1 hypothetical protein PAEVO_03510 [Paenibacillus sp. GM2FR]
MSKVLDLAVEDEVIDYCANEICGKEIFFGQPVTKIGHGLVCSGKCLVEKIGAVTIIAGREVKQESEQEVTDPQL